jgi:hypothetical protein
MATRTHAQWKSTLSWLPIDKLATDDSSYYHTSETKADLNQGGVSLLQTKFPLRTVPEYLHKAVINFRCKQFLDVDQVQRQFQEQLNRLEAAQETHRKDSTQSPAAPDPIDMSWRSNLLLARGKISDIAQQMSRQCNDEARRRIYRSETVLSSSNSVGGHFEGQSSIG